MGHFALVDDGTVTNVIVINNETLDNLAFPASEPVGQEFIATLPDLAVQPGQWMQCSYNANFRGTYPGSGYTFDGTNFVAPESPPDPADQATAREPEIVNP